MTAGGNGDGGGGTGIGGGGLKAMAEVPMKRNEFKVTAFTITETDESTGEERPISAVRVQVTRVRIAPDDPIEFFLAPPEALELADKLRVMALKLGR